MKKIFFVEDDQGILEVARLIFENAGFDLRLFAYAKSLLHNSNMTEADLFILDKQLPDMDGIALCRLLKLDHRTKHIPVLMLSANPQIKELAQAAGADDVLEKPFEIKDFLSIIARLTGQVSSEML